LTRGALVHSAPSSEQPPKVALISTGLGRVMRGIETWMTELAMHLGPGLEVQLWSGGPPPAGVPCAVRRLHALHREALPLRPFNWHRRYLLEQLSVLPRALVLLRRQRMDLAFCGDPALSWHLKRFRSWHGAKVVFSDGMRLSPKWEQDFDGVHLLAPVYLEAARREVPPACFARFFAIPYFVDTRRFHPASVVERAAARRKFGLPEQAFVILNVGPVGQVSGKRLDFLLREAAGLDAESLLVSAGVDEDGAAAVRALGHELLGSRMKFLGVVDRASIPVLFQAADAYALAALQEPFSIAVLEALASGLPVAFNPEEMRGWQVGGGGVAVSMTEPGAAAAVFRRLKADPSWRATLGREARALAVSRYAPEVVCGQLTDALRHCRGNR
jgi:glycosyltransferase involved in cell wall biosynthesis